MTAMLFDAMGTPFDLAPLRAPRRLPVLEQAIAGIAG